MKNSELRQLIFDKIESLGYKIKNVTHPDGYFICDMGEDSVTHFYLKGHGIWKHWKFGLWVEEKYFNPEYVEKCKTEYNMKDEDIHVIQLFAQYDTYIDKFKPSRSSLCLSWDLNDINKYLNGKDKDINGDSYTFNSIERMLGFMCKHPLLAYEEFCGEYAGYFNGSFLWNFIKYEGRDKWNKIKEFINTIIWVSYTSIKIHFAKRSEIIDNIVLFSFEKKNPGWSTSYKYEVNIRFKENATDEEIDNWLDYWWHRRQYGNYKYWDSIVEVTDITKVGEDSIWYMG